MKARDIFDVCHARYRQLRFWLVDSTGAVHSVDLDSPLEGYQWRPDRARACEYIADFERIGRRALRRAPWRGRLRLFNAYFVRGADYRRAVRLVGVAESTFDYWYREVKRTVGGEFARAGLFPPWRYFQPRTANHEGLPGRRLVEPGRKEGLLGRRNHRAPEARQTGPPSPRLGELGGSVALGRSRSLGDQRGPQVDG